MVLLVVGLLVVVVWLLLGSRLLVLRDVAVSGVERATTAEVTTAAGVTTGTPLVLLDTANVVERVEELRLVEEAEVRRSWPATLEVAVTEREPVLSVQTDEGYQLVDHAGVWIEDAAERPADQPTVQVRGEVYGNTAVADAATVRQHLDEHLLQELTEIDARDSEAISLELRDGANVQWGSVHRSQDKAEVLVTLLEEHPPTDELHYDVSSPDVVAVR